MATAIEIEALNKIYRLKKGQTIAAVNNLHLTVPQGQVFGFLGANGAGKTTTIKMICGLVTSTSGRIYICGHESRREHNVAMQQIGAVLEGARNIYWRLSAWENVIYFGQLKGVGGKALRERAELLLKELDLWLHKDRLVGTFSRGMQQKVAIACSLVADPKVILMDEPTLGLDVEASQTVKEWIRRLVKEQGKTVVLTTHQLDMAQELCDHVAIMRKGLLIADHPIGELLKIFKQEHYQIEVKGLVEPGYLSGLEGVQISQEENGNTLISGAIQNPQEKTLNDLLSQLLALNCPVLSITRRDPNLEDVFLQLLRNK